jgi:beta-mannosidase
MKTLIVLILLIVSISSFGQQELSWEFYHPLKKEWFSFGKSGSIQEKLMELKELPPAFYSDNEKEFQWIEDHVWQFRSTFYLTEKEANSRNLILHFPNIDTYGEIMLNNQFIGSTDNFFLPYEFEIQKSVICGYNTLLVTITPPVLFHKSRYESEDFHYPAPNDPAKMKVAPLSRKPQYQFGWDWALRMNTIGFSKPISIIPSGFNAIKSCVVNTLYQSSNVATLLYILDTKKPLVDGFISSSLFGKRPLVIDSLKPNHFLVDFQLENPKLWWPVGFGEPNLYLDTLKLLNADGLVLDKYIIEFGVRTAKLVQNKDEWGTSYEFHVNDIPIFCKGANYIPQSVFNAAVKDSAIENMIDQMLAANFNMVRVWGGRLLSR